jgi:hypothetical protein
MLQKEILPHAQQKGDIILLKERVKVDFNFKFKKFKGKQKKKIHSGKFYKQTTIVSWKIILIVDAKLVVLFVHHERPISISNPHIHPYVTRRTNAPRKV